MQGFCGTIKFEDRSAVQNKEIHSIASDNNEQSSQSQSFHSEDEQGTVLKILSKKVMCDFKRYSQCSKQILQACFVQFCNDVLSILKTDILSF